MKKLYFLLILAFSFAANAEPIINQPNDLNLCNTSGFSIFDLTTSQTQIMEGLDASLHNLTFHISQSDANANINSILNTTSYTNATPNSQTIYVRVEEMSNPNSFSTTSFNINVVENPQIYSFTSPEYHCYNENAVFTIVGTPNSTIVYSVFFQNPNTLTLDSNGNGTISFPYFEPYYNNYEVLEMCLTQISNANCTENLSLCIETIFVSPIFNYGNNFTDFKFESPYDGFFNFNLVANLNYITNSLIYNSNNINPNFDFKFYNSLEEAQTELNPIVNPENYINTTSIEQIYVKFKNLISLCEEIYSFSISIADESLNVYIPDQCFREMLSNTSGYNRVSSDPIYNPIDNSWYQVTNFHSPDSNGDGEIQFSEAEAITYLELNGDGGQCYLQDYTGIEAFINLEYLSVGNNYDNYINLAPFTKLKHFYGTGKWESSLSYFLGDVSQNTELRRVILSKFYADTLDFSHNIKLTDINLSGGYSDFNFDYLNIKNNNSNELNLNFNGAIPQYICADEEDIAMVLQKINQYGYASTCHVNSYCSFSPGGTFYTINGNNRFDTNGNGCESTDINFPNLNFTISNGINSGTFISNDSGFYTFPVSAGTHTLTPNLQNPSYFNISPTSVTVSFPSQASPLLQDFCITPNGTHSDVQISLIPIGVARPGFDATYKLVYKNVGNQLENGTITFKSYNPEVIDFVSSVPVFTTQNEITNLLTYSWNYTNLVPFETREIIINLNLNGPMEIPALNAGDLLSYDAQISTTNADENLLDNFAGIRQEVVNSYDPNDKTCLEGETIDPSMIGKYVHYQIRFENTGTYPAQNVVVKDMIDATKFDVSSLQMVNSSHSCYTRISGNKVEFIFENINLPFEDATNDGYIVFKIKTLPTLTINSTISNTAEIYFDYNFPIITNTATSTYQTLASSSFDFENEFSLYPNPAKNTLHISAKNNLEVSSVEIYNLVGQLVIVKPNFSTSIDVSNLASGTYFIKVNTEKGSGNGKFVKE